MTACAFRLRVPFKGKCSHPKLKFNIPWYPNYQWLFKITRPFFFDTDFVNVVEWISPLFNLEYCMSQLYSETLWEIFLRPVYSIIHLSINIFIQNVWTLAGNMKHASKSLNAFIHVGCFSNFGGMQCPLSYFWSMSIAIQMYDVFDLMYVCVDGVLRK